MPTDAPIATTAARQIPLAHAALFLDLDGTLASFEQAPHEVGPDPRRTALLHRLHDALEGRVAVISGRAVAEIDRILESAARCAAGTHGLERRGVSGDLAAAAAHPELAAAVARIAAFSAERPGLLVEEKGLSVGLHYRSAPQHEAEVHRLAVTIAAETGLTLQKGDRVVELRTPGANKGDAVAAFMDEPPFEGATPIFVGDDLTDEDAFRAAVDLGGYGVLVGPPRPTAASWRLPRQGDVLAWLEALTEAPA
jgi:trehalose 6-phosphate phosphatase